MYIEYIIILYTYDAVYYYRYMLDIRRLNFFRVSLPEETQEKILQKMVE